MGHSYLGMPCLGYHQFDIQGAVIFQRGLFLLNHLVDLRSKSIFLDSYHEALPESTELNFSHLMKLHKLLGQAPKCNNLIVMLQLQHLLLYVAIKIL